MIAQKSNIENQINDFISSLDSNTIFNSSLVSFCVELQIANFYSLLEYSNIEQQKILYLSKPVQNFQVITLGETLSFLFENVEELEINSEKFFRIKNKTINNFSIVNYYPPLFFLYAKFPSEKISELWSEFDKVKLFIPEMVFIADNSKFYIVVNIPTERVSRKSELTDFIKSKFSKLKNVTNSFTVSEINNKIRLSKEEKIESWRIKIDNIITRLQNKQFDKLVLSRCTEFDLLTHIKPVSLAYTLNIKYPECYNFINKIGDTLFFGASPEILFTIKNGIVTTEALAGSTGRDNNDQIDRNLGSELINSKKDIDEHYYVILHLQKILSECCSEIIVEESPGLKKLSNIQHLHTSLNGRLNEDVNIFSIIKKIFPTPAVAGFPVQSAIKAISEIEDFDRGLFTGFIGWMDIKDSSEFIVTIRSALVNSNKLFVYAGCGIVTGSDAEKEYNETQLKSQSIISLFNYED